MNTTYQYTPILLFPFILLFVLATSLSLTAQTTYYVDAQKTDNTGNGMSWATAKKDLQPVLDLATVGDEIRVASGTYLPTDAPIASTTDDRDKAFHLDKNVILKGSYNPDTNMQDYTNPSILSADIAVTPDNDADNAYHVFITANLGSAATIDGFTISGGNADGSENLSYSTQRFYRDDGGGLYNRYSSPTITNSSFSENTAATNGGGLYNASSSPTINNSSFSGNSTENGGGLYNISSSPTITNSTFSGNTASTSAGGLYNDLSSSFPVLYNTVFYSNTVDTANSDISGGSIDESSSHNASDGTGGDINLGTGFVDLLDTNPFIDSTDPDGADDIFRTTDDGLIPHATSLLIDAGYNLKNTEETDIIGNVRIMGSAIDIGAYEVQPILSSDILDVNISTIHPNPATDVLNIEVHSGVIEQVTIYNLSGEKIMSQKTHGRKKQQLDISNLASGVYIIRIGSDQGSSRQKLVKQ